jgi:hypothetical protein
MTKCNDGRWLLLIHQLPPKPAYLRVKVWRRLQSLGAVAIKNSVYVMPKTEPAVEDLQWVAGEIAKDGGEAAICAAAFIEGVSDAQVETLFHAARDADYRQLADEAKTMLRSTAGRPGKARHAAAAALETEFNRLQKRLAAVAAIDFFDAPGRSTAEAALLQLQSRLEPRTARPNRLGKKTELDAADFKGRTWVSRKGVFVDRIACAWLIRRFIDPEAVLVWLDKGREAPATAVTFGYDSATFRNSRNRVTYEEMLASFKLEKDPALVKIGNLVHVLEAGGAKLAEAAGVETLLAGARRRATSDDELLAESEKTFDLLYEAYFELPAKA